MATHSIDYLNARRERKPASGGTRYIVKRNTVDDKAQWNSLDVYEQIQSEIFEQLADLDRSVTALRSHARSFETLASGESLDDLARDFF
jgi:hypothetical protein